MHYESLNQETKKVWDMCGFLRDNFYLAGGTALALQIGHRISVDLDFFSPDPIKKTLVVKIEEKFNSVSVLVNTKNELTLMVENVKMTFLHYPFILKYKTIDTNIVPLASVLDIASMKAYTIGRRRSFKDYVDLYFILFEKHATLETLILDAKEKYNDTFNDRLFCEQLTSPEDLDDEAIIWLQKQQSKTNMQVFFQEKVKEFLA
ncbi:MAG: nucleotidyl transferase AbiEii/AbiGii toxin family protein [Patescibacteria group bacterium]